MGSFNLGVDLSAITDSGADDSVTPAYTPMAEQFPYWTDNQSWIATVPYALQISKGASETTDDVDDIIAGLNLDAYAFYFPINPESLNITTPFAITVTPTAGGIIEENSGVVFYNIQIRGTTGVTPNINFSTGKPISTTSADQEGRPIVKSNLISNNLGGFAANTVNAVNSAANTLLGASTPTVKQFISFGGYMAFHSLYKLICRYNEAKRRGSKAALLFINYKDGNQYQVAVKNFTLIRDKSRPHLYQYSIDMQGWNVDSSSSALEFVTTDTKARLADLGITSGTSAKAELANAIESVKSIARAAANTLNTVAGDLRI